MSAPLHVVIRAELERAILSGALGPGDRLPTEQALMGRYGCSRMTVSKAISALAAAGLVERRRRAGSFVARPRVHAMVLDIPDLAAELARRGQRHRYALLDRRLAGGAGDGAVLALRGLHLADETPLAIETRTVRLAAVPAIIDADFTDQDPGSWLLAHVPWTEAESRIAAEGASAADARLLGVRAGSACLVIDRRTWRGQGWVTQVRQIFLGSAYDLVARFGPAATAGANRPAG